MLEKNPHTVNLIVKHFPLSRHRGARPAATAALAAARQDKFKEYHEMLFKYSNDLNQNRFEAIAKELGLDVEQFKKDMKDPIIQKMIDKDLRDGQQAGVRGIPTIFINGTQLHNRSLKGFQDLIDQLLKNKK